MRKLITLCTIILAFAAFDTSAQFTTFKASEGLSTAQSLANAVGGNFTNMEVFIVGTASQTFGPVTVAFDLSSGKSTAWLYLFRSKENKDSVKAYGVVKVPFLGFQAMEIPYGDIVGMIPFQPDATLKDVTFIDSDAMMTAIRNNSVYKAAATADQSIKLSYCAVAVNPLPIYTVGDPYWAAIFTTQHEKVQCVLNSKTGSLDCFSQEVSVNESVDNLTISAFPNPASSVIFITIPKNIQSAEYTFGLFDQSGNKVTDLKAPTFGETETVSVAVEALPAGAYFLRFASAKGDYNTKFVVAK